MVRGLVAMRILTYHAGDVRRSVGGQRGRDDKERIQLLKERFAASKKPDQACGIVLHRKRSLPRVRLGIVVPVTEVVHIDGIEGRWPGAFGGAGPRAVFE